MTMVGTKRALNTAIILLFAALVLMILHFFTPTRSRTFSRDWTGNQIVVIPPDATSGTLVLRVPFVVEEEAARD